MTAPADRVHQLLDHLFRREAGRIGSRLTRVFGAHRLTVVEDAVQFAMLQALQRWPYKGVPDNPSAWLMRVAGNRAIDVITANQRLLSFDSAEAESDQAEFASAETRRDSAAAFHADLGFERELADEELCLMFICCHPTLPRASSVALTLKMLCGFGVTEIARAFLTTEATISQRLVRAKRLIRDDLIGFEVPGPEELPARLDTALEVLYLFFTEGYAPTSGDRLIKDALCADAIRLTRTLAEHSITGQPACHALLALMLLQASRLQSRADSAGELLLLQDQDRTGWDRSMIAQGLRHLQKAGRGEQLTSFHLQAEIAAVHAVAPAYEQTDWEHIVSLYDLLSEIQPTPVVWVNRAVAIAELDGPQAGLSALDQLPAGIPATLHVCVPMAMGEFHRRHGDAASAVQFFLQALELARTEPERRFVARRLASVREPVTAPAR
jgi:RNA polymerase sigma-70 factor (ECF subfamily)